MDRFLSRSAARIPVYMPTLPQIAAQIRGIAIDLSHQAGTPHLGSSLSCADIVAALYWNVLDASPDRADHPDRDRFILSKGHAVTTLYAALALRGYFPAAEFATYNQTGTRLPEHPAPHCAPGIEHATGSLGHGLSVGLGIALGNRIQASPGRVFVLLSDGECNEGSTWEAALLAPALQLGRLCAIVDCNKWQATGRSQEVTALEPLDQKFAAFGWETRRVDGHDLPALVQALQLCPAPSGKPLAIVADTVKGKGVSFMEDDNNWHYRIPTTDEVAAAKKELGLS